MGHDRTGADHPPGTAGSRTARPEPAVVSSPLARAVATATPIAEALGTTVEIDDGLLELDFGQWEGRTFDDVKRGWRAERVAFRAIPYYLWGNRGAGDMAVWLRVKN